MTFTLTIPRRLTREDLTLNLLRCEFLNFTFSIAAFADVYFDLYAVFPGKDCLMARGLCLICVCFCITGGC